MGSTFYERQNDSKHTNHEGEKAEVHTMKKEDTK